MNITLLIRINFFVFKIKNHLDKGFMTSVQLVFFLPMEYHTIWLQFKLAWPTHFVYTFNLKEKLLYVTSEFKLLVKLEWMGFYGF